MATQKTGCLEMIIGCMYSGKSTEMLRRYRMYRLLDRKVMAITHIIDKRYAVESVICSHTHDSEPAFKVSSLTGILDHPDFSSYDIICIDEAQFFNDLYSFVVTAVEEHKKHIILACLDGTFERKPFQQVVQLIPFSDDVIKLKTLCAICNNGTPAAFSKRITSERDILVVGGTEAYTGVCRAHYA